MLPHVAYSSAFASGSALTLGFGFFFRFFFALSAEVPRPLERRGVC